MGGSSGVRDAGADAENAANENDSQTKNAATGPEAGLWKCEIFAESLGFY
ncbi:MAG: hypothetical protein WD671_08365 [Parvibaculum sp.]